MLDNELALRRELESVSSEQLRVMLRTETGKAVPDDDLVLTILHILEDREPDEMAPPSPREEAAWKQFRKRGRARKKKPLLSMRKLSSAAVLLLVVSLLMAAIPQQAEADNWWDRIARWTDDFFGFFREEEENPFHLEDYQFRTDNPGLQQIYDAVVELGVTEPVVPMWLPEGYELADLKTYTTENVKTVSAMLKNSDRTIIYQLAILSGNVNGQYMKDQTQVKTHEKYNTTYNIMRNNELWVVAWTKNNIECSFAVDCQEEVLYEILNSIYTWRMIE